MSSWVLLHGKLCNLMCSWKLFSTRRDDLRNLYCWKFLSKLDRLNKYHPSFLPERHLPEWEFNFMFDCHCRIIS